MSISKLTKEQALIIMGFTGITTISILDFHEDVERRLGRPILTHQFPSLSEEITDAYREDFLSICYTGKEEE